MDAVWAEMPVLTEYWIGGEYDYSGYTGFNDTYGADSHTHKNIAKEFRLLAHKRQQHTRLAASKTNTPYLFYVKCYNKLFFRGRRGQITDMSLNTLFTKKHKRVHSLMRQIPTKASIA